MRKLSPFPNQASLQADSAQPTKICTANDHLLAPPENFNSSTVVPPVSMSPDPVLPQQPPPAKPTHGNGVTPSKAPVVPSNSMTTSPLPTNSTKTDTPAIVDDGLLRNPPGGTQITPSMSGKEGFSDEADPEKLKKWAEHFGSSNMPTQLVKSGLKRAAHVEEIDTEELEW
ncbi:hypothetical protein EDC04DRAFT_2912688 [Pisolithus marmoratus]|nr:hypothetical protein EDC04DRAFT_2912688 [Pisolithus marmoratus]